jgi:2-dehydropantoate 2-reductase
MTRSTGFDVETTHRPAFVREVAPYALRMDDMNRRERKDEEPPFGAIKSLIVCLKTTATLEALSILQPRLSPSSVITLVQNGMGVFDEMCQKLWPDPLTRPHFILGTTTHGARRKDNVERWSIVHATKPGTGELRFGIAPDPRQQVDFEKWIWGQTVGTMPILSPPPSPGLPLPPLPRSSVDLVPMRNTLEALLSLTQLSPTLLPMPHLHHELLLKLAINSVINPLTAVLGAGAIPNGALFGSTPGHRLIRTLTSETSEILTAYLRSLSHPHSPAPDVLRMFSRGALEKRILAVIRSTADNQSSMASDVSNGQVTEIQHINGYLVSLGQRLQIPAKAHEMMVNMVNFTSQLNGMSPHVSPEIVQRTIQRRRFVREGYMSAKTFKTPEELALEAKKLVLDERRLLVEEHAARKELLSSRASSRRKLYAGWYERVCEIMKDQAPSLKEWRAMQRRDKSLLYGKCVASVEGPKLTPPFRKGSKELQEVDQVDDPLSNESSESVASADHAETASSGTNANDHEPVSVSAGPMAESGKTSSEESSTATTSHESLTPRQSYRVEDTADIMSAMINAAPRQSYPYDEESSVSTLNPLSSPATNPPSSPSSSPRSLPLAMSINSLISSAPRAERSWDEDGATICGYTGLAPFLPKEGIADLARGGIGSALDDLISGAPRQEQTWDDDRALKKVNGGKYTTSRTSGS